MTRSDAGIPRLQGSARRLRGLLLSAAALSVALLAGPQAWSATYVVPADDMLIGKSPVIVRGQVTNVAAVRAYSGPADPGGIHTDVTIAIDRVLKGLVRNASVILRQPGGQVGDEIESYPGIGSFAQGDEVLVMLEPIRDSGTFRVVDFALGNFRVLKAPDGHEFLRREGLREAFVLGGSGTTGALSALSSPSPSGGAEGFQDPDRDAALFEQYIDAVSRGLDAKIAYQLAPQTATVTSEEDRTAAFVFLGSPARRTEFEVGTTVTYKDNSTGDNGTTCGGDHCHAATAAGVVAWNATPVTAIKLAYGGTDGGIGSSCLSQLNNEIQYNDPCSEIPNLTSCSGTLALGGFSANSSGGGTPYCPAKGNPSFGRIVNSKILVNNGVGTCLTGCDFTEMIAHETGHTLGAGHTTVVGSLMQATLHSGFCGVLGPDDQAFAQCAYPQTELSCDLKATQIWGGPPPMTVSFDSHPLGGIPGYTYAYDFGDGGSSTAATPSHTFQTAAAFTAQVTVTDGNDQTCSGSLDVTVLSCKPPRLTSVTAKYVDGTWRAIATGSRFKAGATLEFDPDGNGYQAPPKTKYLSSTKLQGRDVGAVWPPGTSVTVHVINPNGCPSNPLIITR